MKMFVLNGNALTGITGVRILEGVHESLYSDQVCTPRIVVSTVGSGSELFEGNNAECALDELLRCGIYTEQQHQQAVISLRVMQDDFIERREAKATAKHLIGEV